MGEARCHLHCEARQVQQGQPRWLRGQRPTPPSNHAQPSFCVSLHWEAYLRCKRCDIHRGSEITRSNGTRARRLGQCSSANKCWGATGALPGIPVACSATVAENSCAIGDLLLDGTKSNILRFRRRRRLTAVRHCERTHTTCSHHPCCSLHRLVPPRLQSVFLRHLGQHDAQIGAGINHREHRCHSQRVSQQRSVTEILRKIEEQGRFSVVSQFSVSKTQEDSPAHPDQPNESDTPGSKTAPTESSATLIIAFTRSVRGPPQWSGDMKA